MEKIAEEPWKDITNRHMGDIFHARGNSSCNQGDFTASLNYYKKALELYKLNENQDDEFTKNSKIADTLNNIAIVHRYLGDYDKAISILENSLDIKSKLNVSRKNFSENPLPTLGHSLNNLGLLYQDKRNFKQALDFFFEGLECYEKAYKNEPNHPNIASILNNIGLCYQDAEDYVKSLDFLNDALEVYNKIHRFNRRNSEISDCLNNIGVNHHHLGEFEKSIDYTKESLDIKTRIYDSSNPSLIVSFNNAALSYHHLGDYNNLIKFLNKATDAYFLTYDKTNRFNILAVLSTAAQRSKDEYKKSNEFYSKSLDVFQRKPNQNNDVLIATCLNNMSLNFQRLTEYQTSNDLLGKSMQITTTFNNQISLADQYSRLAENYHYLDEHQKCVEFAQKALSVYSKLSSDRASRMGEAFSLRNIGCSQIQLGNKKTAVEALEKSLQVYKTQVYPGSSSSLAESQPCVADTCHYLGVAYQMPPKPDYKKSLEQIRRALSIKQKCLDDEHPSIIETLSLLGSTHQDMGEYVKAIEYLEQASAIYNKKLSSSPTSSIANTDTESFFDYAFVLNNLGMCKRNVDDYDGSMKSYEQAYAIYAKYLGESHANTKIVLENLEKTKQMSSTEKTRKKSFRSSFSVKEKQSQPKLINKEYLEASLKKNVENVEEKATTSPSSTTNVVPVVLSKEELSKRKKEEEKLKKEEEKRKKLEEKQAKEEAKRKKIEEDKRVKEAVKRAKEAEKKRVEEEKKKKKEDEKARLEEEKRKKKEAKAGKSKADSSTSVSSSKVQKKNEANDGNEEDKDAAYEALISKVESQTINERDNENNNNFAKKGKKTKGCCF